MAQCHENIKKFRKEYHLTKKECADLFGVAENTIGNYENKNKNQLIKSYVLVNLKMDNKYKDIPLEFFLGLTSSMEKENIEINENLGLSDKSIKVLKNIVKDDNDLRKQIKLFTINSLIENINFDKLGRMLIFPNYENKKIKAEEFYELYSNYFQDSYYQHTHDDIEKERDINDFRLNKMFIKFCDNIRNSENCISLFRSFIKEKWELENMRDNYDDWNNENDNSINDTNYNEIEYEDPKIEREEIIKKRKEEIGI